jgi:hypothetical protein
MVYEFSIILTSFCRFGLFQLRLFTSRGFQYIRKTVLSVMLAPEICRSGVVPKTQSSFHQYIIKTVLSVMLAPEICRSGVVPKTQSSYHQYIIKTVLSVMLAPEICRSGVIPKTQSSYHQYPINYTNIQCQHLLKQAVHNSHKC